MKKKVKIKKTDTYLYVCYPITTVRENEYGLVGIYDYNEAESFTDIKRAERFLKENYAQYILAIEKADDDLIEEVKKCQLYEQVD